ncbi:YdcH family protein [Desertibaculum subflavum]|uniref:YdcH family protein n=1 Tax=Desertibaculum subflavum TaxID=2268458 RepID=UPI000E66CF4F
MQPELRSLIERHRRLDIEITRVAGQPVIPWLTIQRLKRLRLALKDRIAAITARVAGARHERAAEPSR